MSSEESLDEFKCALSDDYKHFLIEPIVLINCGHSVCKSCILNESSNTIKCKICEIETEIDLKTAKVSAALKISIKYLYENMFQLIEKETFSKLNHIKDISENQIELLNVKVKYIEDEIDIRIESIKDQLDIAREKLRDDLDKIKQELKKKIEENSLTADKLLSYDSILSDLQNDIQSKVKLNEEGLDKYQKNIKELNEIIKKYDLNVSKELDINISNELINEKTIGEIFNHFIEKNNHPDPICRVCSLKELNFDRYKCIICADYDLCESCFENRNVSLGHLTSHPVIKYTGPSEIFGETITNKNLDLNYAELFNIFKEFKHEYKNYRCDGCNICPIVGIRFNCDECYNFDLCTKCYENQIEVMTHKQSHCLVVEKNRLAKPIFQ